MGLPALAMSEDVTFAAGPVENFGRQTAHGLPPTRAGFLRARQQPLTMTKSFTGSRAVGRPPLAMDSLLVRPEARLPHLPD